MIHEVLISVQNSLSSRIALRYVEQLESAVRFNLQAVHVPEFTEDGPNPGCGWVRQKWEKAVVRQAREKVAHLIRDEYFYRFSDAGLKTLEGPKTQMILGELEDRSYDFFIEGQLHAFEPDRFLAGLDVYRAFPCPVLVVKNLVALTCGVRILVTADEGPPRVLPWLAELLARLPGDLEVLDCSFDSADFEIRENHDIPALPDAWTDSCRRRTVQGTPETLDEAVRDAALVVAVLPDRQSALARLLARVPSAVLLCPASDRPTTESEATA